MSTMAVGGATYSSAPQDLLRPAGGSLGKDEFLQLLVTQLRYQDPLNPMQPENFAAQLAQFSSLEQLVNANARLDEQITHMYALAQGMNSNAALGVLGQTVLAAVDQVVVPEEGAGNFTVEVGKGGGSAVLHLYDANGKEVGTRELGSLAAGRHTLPLGSAADSLPPGVYRCKVEVTNAAGETVPTQPLATARVDGVRYGPAGPILVAGKLEIPLGAVLEVVAKS
jgi:flagellar basal-body rod modification protein FlgD